MALKRPKQPMADFIKAELEATGLMDAYSSRPAYQQNDYLWWINDAKREETKLKRLGKMVTELRAGHGYMGMEWSPSGK